VTAARVAADSPSRHEQQRVPVVASPAPASLPNTSPSAHTTPISSAIVIVGKAKRVDHFSALADADAVADLGVEAEDVSISVTSASSSTCVYGS
jgi:hypothetical protein